MADGLRIIVLEGDETGQELLEAALRALDSEVLGSTSSSSATTCRSTTAARPTTSVVTEAAEAMREARFGLKAATVTPEGKDDVGSPNRILREAIDGKVIIRTGRRIPGVNAGGRPAPPGRRWCGWRWATPTAPSSGARRRTATSTRCAPRRSRARSARRWPSTSFRTAERIEGKVYGGPKWTVSPVYEGMLKEEMDAAAERHSEVEYEPVLIDATYAGLITGAGDSPLVIPALNRDGDCLSDLVHAACTARSPARSRCCWRSTTTTSPAP